MRDSIFVMHLEPFNHEYSIDEFMRFLDAAYVRNMPLSIEIHPNWMKYMMGLANNGNRYFIDKLESTLNINILGVHHHGRSHKVWDGYTNVSYELLTEDEKKEYVGNMDDFELIVNQFQQFLLSDEFECPLNFVCMTDEDTDFYSRFIINTQGIDWYDAISTPILKNYNGVETIEIKHGFPRNNEIQQKMRRAFDSSRQGVFGTVFHGGNYNQQYIGFINFWMDFLNQNSNPKLVTDL